MVSKSSTEAYRYGKSAKFLIIGLESDREWCLGTDYAAVPGLGWKGK